MTAPRTFILAAFAALAAPAMSLAEEPAALQITIDRAALTTPAGAEAAYQQIAGAALTVCRAENRHGAGFERALRICITDTIERSVSALDAPLVDAQHAARPATITLAQLDRKRPF
ncbi:MAG: UrcA family protein [Pseudomonadota bacterium]